MQVWDTSSDFIGLGLPVARGPALDHVANEHLFSRKTDRGEDLGEQLPGASHERAPRLVLGRTGSLPNNHQPGVGSAFPWNGVQAAFTEAARATVSNSLSYPSQIERGQGVVREKILGR
jgi:hypothetical protein